MTCTAVLVPRWARYWRLQLLSVRWRLPTRVGGLVSFRPVELLQAFGELAHRFPYLAQIDLHRCGLQPSGVTAPGRPVSSRFGGQLP